MIDVSNQNIGSRWIFHRTLEKLTWRKIQVQKYLACKPNDKGEPILRLTLTQVPDPWPEASVRKINRIIKCLQNASKDNKVSWNLKHKKA